MTDRKYMITLQDAAVYLFLENAYHKRENEVLHDLFANHNQSIVREYAKDYLQLKQCVMNLLNIYELDDASYDEVELVLKEIENTKFYSNEEEVDCFAAYFKLIWLQLMCSGITYRKIKLRNLLKDFGYKRRSAALVNNIQQAIDKLGLKTYLRGHVPCNICDVDLDDVIIIRLTN